MYLTFFCQLDILVCNAGRSQRARWIDIEIEVDKAVFDVNVFSLVSLTRIAVRYFLERYCRVNGEWKNVECLECVDTKCGDMNLLIDYRWNVQIWNFITFSVL